MKQDEFDLMIGQLDHLLSKLMLVAKEEMSEANKQRLKHHIEDMELCCAALRKRLLLKSTTTFDVSGFRAWLQAEHDQAWRNVASTESASNKLYSDYNKHRQDTCRRHLDMLDAMLEGTQSKPVVVQPETELDKRFREAPSLELLRAKWPQFEFQQCDSGYYWSFLDRKRHGDLKLLDEECKRYVETLSNSVDVVV